MVHELVFFLVITEGKYPVSAPKHHVKNKMIFMTPYLNYYMYVTTYTFFFLYKHDLNMFITTFLNYLLNVLFITWDRKRIKQQTVY